MIGGRRVPKDSCRVEALGAVDELNGMLGLVMSELDDSDLLEHLRIVQNTLFRVGGELATPEIEKRKRQVGSLRRIGERDVEEFESWIDTLDAEVEPLHNFVLPGGAPGAARLHLARSVCRRAERRVITLTESEPVAPVLVRYLNRLSDLLFVMARVVNHRRGVTESVWTGGD